MILTSPRRPHETENPDLRISSLVRAMLIDPVVVVVVVSHLTRTHARNAGSPFSSDYTARTPYYPLFITILQFAGTLSELLLLDVLEKSRVCRTSVWFLSRSLAPFPELHSQNLLSRGSDSCKNDEGEGYSKRESIVRQTERERERFSSPISSTSYVSCLEPLFPKR